MLRTLAEMENLRRRTEREIADGRPYAITSFARDLVGVADNIRRSLDAASDAGVVSDGPAKALVDGVELTERELLKVLEKNGVRIQPQGSNQTPISTRRCSRCPIPKYLPASWCRSSNPAT